jgi:hypothetical protein
MWVEFVFFFFPHQFAKGGPKGLRNAQQLGTERQIHVIKVRVAVAKTTTTVTIRGRASVA